MKLVKKASQDFFDKLNHPAGLSRRVVVIQAFFCFASAFSIKRSA